VPLGPYFVRLGIELSKSGLDALAEAGLALGSAAGLSDALRIVADGAARGVPADVVVARVLEDDGRRLQACVVASTSAALAAELEGSRVPRAEVPEHEESDLARLPAAVQRAAERAGASFAVLLPVHVDGEVRGTLELLRQGAAFDEAERRLARLAAGQASLAIRAFGSGRPSAPDLHPEALLTVAGDALAAGADEARTGDQVVRFAVAASGAQTGVLWARGDGGELEPIASVGRSETELAPAAAAALRALQGREAIVVERANGGLAAILQLGHPPLGALELLYPDERAPTDQDLATLATFGVRAAQALRASLRARTLALELERTRALLTIVGQAIAQLSLSHTLDTAVARVAELLDTERVAVYLRNNDRMSAAAGVGLAGPHERLAGRLLELALGPFRSRGMLVVEDVTTDPRLGGVADAAAEAGIQAAIAVPLLARDEVIGLLGVFPAKGRVLTENESTLLAALAAQLAVAVQNAQLHEQAKRLGDERERALKSEQAASRQVRALYEISRSFAQSLSLKATLDAVASTVVDVLDVDIAVIRMPDERREWLVPRAFEAADPQLEKAARAILERPLAFGAHSIQRLFRDRESFWLTADERPELAPFLARGWTGAAVPVATPAEVLASLSIYSVRPGAPVTYDKIEQASAIAGQAALAIDNARLYQQQKEFADTMQRSLLPQSVPELQGLELGDAYESSARVEVGGDVYDFMELPDGRLAVALGDVTGHGIEAAADMAMAKFVFRSLAREHPEPADFLQSANDVVVDEIAPGKFITMAYLVIDGRKGELAAAGAGHPSPRIVRADGTVTALETRGLVMGIEPGQEYDEVRAPLASGDAVVLFTDGVLEARRDGELYGFARLDRMLSEQRELPPAELARTILDDCRSFARGELADDCAVVVVRRQA
jgi:serine phosphatase RsbU (regulator of sigma subunit)